MLKENVDTNSSLENYSDKFSLPPLPAEKNQSNSESMNNSVQEQLEIQTSTQHILKQIDSLFFNEMTDDQAFSSEVVEKIQNWLSQYSIYELGKLNETAKAHFLYQGITFAVYGEQAGIERTIPFDLIPRVIAKQQWNKISLGCTQRIKA